MALTKLVDGVRVVMSASEESAFVADQAAAAASAAAAIPERVTKLQFCLALASALMLDAVEAAIAAADQNTQLRWHHARWIYPSDPAIVALGAGLGVTDEQIAQLFRDAALIE